MCPRRIMRFVTALIMYNHEIKQQDLVSVETNYPEMSDEDMAKVLQTCKVSKHGTLRATLPAKRA